MTSALPPEKVGIARLRAAAALIPIIESGLANAKIPADRAALMSEFCLWTTRADFGECEESKASAKAVLEGLARVKALLR